MKNTRFPVKRRSACLFYAFSMYILGMVNKHDQFESFILERLARGVTKSQIARDLLALGVGSTQDQLSRWLKRRADRIVRNAFLVDPLNAPKPAPVNTSTPACGSGTQDVSISTTTPVQSPPLPATDFRKRGTFNFDLPSEDDLTADRKGQDPLGLLKKTPD